jgi:tetratricopeptide (TPR) repeat protein
MRKFRILLGGIAIGLVLVLAGGSMGCASGPHTAKQKKAQKWVERGLASHDKSEYDQAITYYTRAIELNPQDSVAYYHRGNSYYAGGMNDRYRRYGLAIADYNEAIRLNPQNANVYWKRGRAYAGIEKYDLAIADYTQAIQLNPGETELYKDRGDSYLNKKDYSQAMADYELALQISPENTITMQKKEEAEKRLAEEAADRYDPAKFILTTHGFRPSQHKSMDLFDAVAQWTGYRALFVSDVVFVGQSGLDIWFKTEDNAISQSMQIRSRSGLQEGQRVRVYYTITQPLDFALPRSWHVDAIERL